MPKRLSRARLDRRDRIAAKPVPGGTCTPADAQARRTTLRAFPDDPALGPLP